MTAWTRGDLRRRAAALLLCCAVLAVPAAAEYRTVEVESLRITIDTDWIPRSAPGYFPVRFEITNLGEPRVIEIRGAGMRFFRFSRFSRAGSMGGSSVQYPLRLGRGDRVRLTIPMPIFGDNENLSFDVREDGRVIERFSYIGTQSNIPAGNASALIVADGSSALGRAAAGLVRKISTTSSGSTMRGTPPPFDMTLDPSRLPGTWLGFTSVRAVLLGPTEWQQLRDDQKSALLEWTACGGDLVLVDGTFDTLGPLVAGATPTGPATTVRAYFFGRIHLAALETLNDSGIASFLAAADKSHDSNWSLPVNRARDWGVVAARGFRLPIPGIQGAPARAYFAILFIFALLIGPVNYWILRRQGRPVLLVLTTPVISTLFILLLGGYVLAGEGIGVRGRVVSFTMLDEMRKQAVSRATVSLYAAGMTPSGGLRFPRDTAVFPLGRDSVGSREMLTLDLSEQQRFASGLIQARAPSNFEEIAVRPARERLTFRREGGGIAVVNGLGATITTLVYREGATVYQLTRPLAQGETATLSAGAPPSATIVPTDLPLSARLLFLFEHQPAGSYLAVLERSPFWDAGVSGVDERGSFHLVLGWPGGQP